MVQALFYRILQMHKTAAAVILAVLAVRLMLKKAPKKWSYALWSVVGFRLVCPVSFQSAFSLFNLQPKSATMVPQPGGPYTMQGPPTVYPTPSVPVMPYSHSAEIPMPTPAPDPMTVFLTIGTAVWILGMIVILIYSIISYVKLKLQMTAAIRLEQDVWLSDRVRSPFILGFIRPRIYLPFGLEPNAQRYVLRHERCHLRHFDHWVKAFAFLLLAVHWFDPLVWLAFYWMVKDMEMRTDEEVLAAETESKQAYSMTLLSFAANRRFPSPNPLAFGESGVKARIRNVLRWKRPKLRITIPALILCVILIAACAADPKDDTPDPTCMVTVNEVSVAAQYYAEGFDYNYDKLMNLTPAEAGVYTLTFDVSWEPDSLTVSEGYYESSGDVAHITHTIKKNPDGRFTLEVPTPDSDMEYAVYLIFAETGVFAIKVYFQPCRYWNIQITPENLTRTGAIIQLQNNTVKDGIPQTGTRFWLERLDGSQWKSVDAEADAAAVWYLPAYDIGSTPLTMECDWSHLYGSLPDGIYRLGKEISDGSETMNCYFMFSFPSHLAEEPSCPVKIGSLDVPVRWFPEGYNFEYEKLTPLFLPYQEAYELVFSPSWSPRILKIGQDFYTRSGSASTVYCESYDLNKGTDRAFTFEVQRMNPHEAEKAVYYIPYEDGKFVFQLEFAAKEADPDPLETAIHKAILEQGRSKNSEPYFSWESHVTLDHAHSDGRADNHSAWSGQDTLYLMVLYQEYEISENGIVPQGGSHMPVRLTFDRYIDGRYELLEYWTPDDGTLYESSIKETFPEFIHADALDTQKYILPQIQSCYAQAIAYAGLDPASILAKLFDQIASTPAWSSNPGDYLNAHPIEVRELTYYGDYALDYIFRAFLNGDQIGLHGHLMRHVMDLLIGAEAIDVTYFTGQDYFDQWRTHVIQLSENHEESWMQEHAPKGMLLLQILQ